MTAEILSRLLWMSLTGTVVIAAVLLLRVLLRHAPKIFSYLLWGLVLFRLLCPFAPESDLSVVLREPKNHREAEKQQTEDGRVLDLVRQFVTKEADRGTILSTREKMDTVQKRTEKQKYLFGKNADTVIFVIWILGMSAMAFYAVYSENRLRKFLKNAVCCRENIYIVNGIDTPFVLGILSPKIYLPDGLSEKEKEYMLLHEQTHIRRNDIFFRRLSFLALTVHWFHPLVWCAFFLSGRDMEMSCDEAVVKRLGDSVKQAYSKSLLKLSEQKETVFRIPTAFGGGDTGKRIKNILRYRQAKKGIAVLCVMVLFAALVTLTTNPPRATEKETQAAEEQQTTENGPDAGSFHEDATRQEAGEALVQVKSIARSAKTIDSMEPDEEIAAVLGEEPAFSEDCRFYINYPIESYSPQEVSFQEFADIIGKWNHELLKPCLIEYKDGLVCKITLPGARIPYGISYEPLPVSEGKTSAYEEIKQLYGEDVLEKHYHLMSTEELDVADCEGTEIIEVYAGNAGDGDSGIVLVKDAGGKLIYSEWAHAARAGWNNIYAGKVDGGGDGFLMTLHLENRDTYGEYSYQVFRIGADGETLNQLAGSTFVWEEHGPWQYEADEFAKFCHMMGHHLDDGHLLLSTQESELRTNGGSDSEIYCYRTMAPPCFEDPYEGMDIR